MNTKKGKNWIKRALDATRYAMKSARRWFKRMFFGGDKGLNVEETETPARLLRERFFRKKAAVGALIFLIALFFSEFCVVLVCFLESFSFCMRTNFSFFFF